MNDAELSVKSQMALVVDKCETATEKIEELTKFKAKIIQEIDDTIDNISRAMSIARNAANGIKIERGKLRL